MSADLCGNGVQNMAIAHAAGPMQVLAGPGSGKTYLTIHRVRHLILHHGIAPEHILVITFTRAAAQEMERRFLELTGSAYPSVHFGTFHAVYRHILKSSHAPFHLASAADKTGCLKHALKNSGITEEPDAFLVSSLFKKISMAKNSENPEELLNRPSFSEDIPSVDGFPPGRLREVFREYCLWMSEKHVIDFDDIILLCGRLLRNHPAVLAHWQECFPYILIDEFQDISPMQYQIIRMLASPRDNIFVVGDDDQSIYGFRGAGPDIMRRFLEDYPSARQLLLSSNYRCGDQIVQAAETVIAGNKQRFKKNIISENPGENSVTVHSFGTLEEEYRYLTESLKKIPAPKLAAHAAIFRTNAQAAGFSRQLAACHIPFFMKEHVENLFETAIALDLIAYLRFAGASAAVGQTDQNAGIRSGPAKGGTRADFFRIMNRPLRYISRDSADLPFVSFDRLLRFYKRNPYMQKTVSDLCLQLGRVAVLRPCLALDYIRKSMGYNRYLKESRTPAEYERCMETADAVQQSASGFQTAGEWIAFTAQYTEAVKRRTDRQERKHPEETPGIRLLTMHASKGLEFENVWLPDAAEGTVPSKKALSSGQVEEERRLFYVAMTRAKKRLEILYHGTPSRFIVPLLK